MANDVVYKGNKSQGDDAINLGNRTGFEKSLQKFATPAKDVSSEVKRSPKKRVNKKRTLLIAIILVIATLVTVGIAITVAAIMNGLRNKGVDIPPEDEIVQDIGDALEGSEDSLEIPEEDTPVIEEEAPSPFEVHIAFQDHINYYMPKLEEGEWGYEYEPFLIYLYNPAVESGALDPTGTLEEQVEQLVRYWLSLSSDARDMYTGPYGTGMYL